MFDIVLTFLLSFILTLLLGFIFIPAFRRMKFGQTVRDDGPDSHLKKTGIPTMGGVIIILSIIFSLLITAPFDSMLLWALVITSGYGIIGFFDDLIIILANRTLGLRAWHKLVGQIFFGLLIAYYTLNNTSLGSEIMLPFSDFTLDLGYFYIPFAVLVVIGASNAVNLSDGLDGLAAGLMIIAASAYLVITFVLDYYSLSFFTSAIIGSSLGFIWFNAHPAQVFMGDIGSLALGAGLGAAALLTKTELFLLIIGGVFVIETLSVIIQVIYFRATGGGRIFRMSPLHHHFELKGWKEPKIVTRFWILGVFFSIIGLLGL